MGQFFLPPSDATISLSDVPTNNSSTAMHGFLPKLSGIATQFLNGNGQWVPVVAQEFISGVSVANYAALPPAAANSGLMALVLNNSGIWLINFQSKGIYYSDGVNWNYEGDYVITSTADHIGVTPVGGITSTDAQSALAELDAKKLSQIQFIDGWMFDPNTWTCTVAGVAGSNNANGSINITPVAAQFTIPGDQTTTFIRGLKVKFTQTTVKYGYVQSSSFAAGITTVILFANADHLMTVSTITSPSFSFGNPSGFPQWFNIKTAAFPGSGAFTAISLNTRMKMLGSQIILYTGTTITTPGTASSDFFITLPIASSSALFSSGGLETTVAGWGITSFSFANAYIRISKYDGTSPITIAGSVLVATLIYD